MQKSLEKQKASFVSPSTKEQQRKPLVNLTIFAYVISGKRRENQQKKKKKIQRNVFLSICSSHAETYM